MLYDGLIERITVGTAKYEDETDSPVNSTSNSNAHKRMRVDTEKVSIPKNKQEDSKSVDKGLTTLRRSRILPDSEPFVYRVLQPLMPQLDEQEEKDEECMIDNLVPQPPKVSGLSDMPCGHCPSFDICFSKGKGWQVRGNGSQICLDSIRTGLSNKVAPVNPAECVYL